MSQLDFTLRHDRESFAGTGLQSGERAPVIRTGEREPIRRAVRRLVYERDDWTCQHCRSTPNARDPYRRSGPLHLDHIVPWSAGGSDRSDNLRTLCERCNQARSNFVSADDMPSLPIVMVCARCMAGFNPQVRQWVESPLERFIVYCATCKQASFALKGWRIL